MVKKENDQELVSIKKMILSMSFSLVLVVAVLLFIFGFRYFFERKMSIRVRMFKKKNERMIMMLHKEYLETDKSFKAGYIMIKDLPAKGLYISELPGKKEN